MNNSYSRVSDRVQVKELFVLSSLDSPDQVKNDLSRDDVKRYREVQRVTHLFLKANLIFCKD